MSLKQDLTYRVNVQDDTEYQIKVRIGDAQDGDHNVFGTCPYDTRPENDNPEWISKLGIGTELKNKVLYISSATHDNNPYSSWVSVRVYLNDEQIFPEEGDYELQVDDEVIVYFNQQISFL